MKLTAISAIAVSSVFCVQQALSKTTPIDSLTETPFEFEDSVTDSIISTRLDLIADSIHFVHFEEGIDVPPIFEFEPATVEGRLAYLQQTVPLTYNAEVQSYIDVYSTDRYKGHLSRMMGLGAFYFPIYERVFQETGIPDEIKYLSIVESALNPHAISRVGATGLWQFMFATARMYDLSMDSYVDERKDPVAASYAAAAYLLDAYNDFGDWLLAIASYNCGKGNVTRAIQRSGLSQPDFWAISPYLPRETRKYVPAFIAMTYMLGYHREHAIEPNAPEDFLANTETVWVQKFVPFSNVARALDIDESVIRTLNPAYKRGVVNGSVEFPKRLTLPAVPPDTYAVLYAALNTAPEVPMAVLASNNTDRSGGERAATHVVRKGETLSSIAARHRVTVQDLRAWNNIRKQVIVPGQRLNLFVSTAAASTTGGGGAKPAANATHITYRVKKGDTLSGIAQQHRHASVSNIKADNGLTSNSIKPGMVLKIKAL